MGGTLETRNIIYYTCNTHIPEIDNLAREYLSKVDLPIISVSLNKQIDFGDIQIFMQGNRSPLTMHKQIVKGLEKSEAKYAFLAESDVLYHPSHFDFTPKRDDTYYFNVNVWKMHWEKKHFVRTANSQQLSGMVANRKLILDFFKKRIEDIEKDGWNRRYEPPRKQRENYSSKVPNIDIRHNMNLTQSKWSIKDFVNKQYAEGWQEADSVEGWDL